MFEKMISLFGRVFISKKGVHGDMNRLRLFNFGRGAGIWQQLFQNIGRKNRQRRTMWTLLSLGGLGIVAAALGMRRGRTNFGMIQRPIQQVMSGVNRFMNNTRRPNLAPVELAQEMTARPKNVQNNNNQNPNQK
jgi:hypothetical protein